MAGLAHCLAVPGVELSTPIRYFYDVVGFCCCAYTFVGVAELALVPVPGEYPLPPSAVLGGGCSGGGGVTPHGVPYRVRGVH